MRPLTFLIVSAFALPVAAASAQPPGLSSMPALVLSTAEWSVDLSFAVREHWRAPVGSIVSKQPVIDIEINKKGELTGARVQSSSGNLTYDSSVVHAIRKASPLPLPKDRSAFTSQLRIVFNPDPERPLSIRPLSLLRTANNSASQPAGAANATN